MTAATDGLRVSNANHKWELPEGVMSAVPAAAMPSGYRLEEWGLFEERINIKESLTLPEDIKAVVFDLNGTIVETEQAYREALRRSTERLYDLKISPENWDRIQTAWYMSDMLVCRTVINAVRRMFPDAYSNNPEVTTRRLSLEQRRVFNTEWQTLPLQLVEGSEILLEKLQGSGVKIGLATGSPVEDVKTAFEKLGIGEFFEQMTFGVELPEALQKPHPLSYRLNLHGIQTSPETDHCLAFENSVSGALSAFQAGLNTIVRVAPEDISRFVANLRLLARTNGLLLPDLSVYSNAKITILESWSCVSF
jgi:beta-phosphoglucomutase-like phosphatase (HAD superfamily)